MGFAIAELPEDPPQILTVDILHREEVATLGLPDVMDLDDVVVM